jgi:hypothetical protein
MNQYMDKKGSEQPDRRKRPNLRILFDDVVRRVEPFFRKEGGINGSRPDFWVTRTISDAYPDLNNEEAHMLAKAAIRYFQERK